jgi:CRISPR-associated endonuclease Csn1
MKKILGLDLGTNSIGWALISENEEKKEIIGMGSRIIPMSQDILGEFDRGNSV